MSNVRWIKFVLFAIFVAAIPTQFSQAQDQVDPDFFILDLVGAIFADDIKATTTISQNSTYGTRKIFRGEGLQSQVAVGYAAKQVKFKDPDLLLRTQLGGKTEYLQHSINADISQGLGIGRDIGTSVGYTTSSLGSTASGGVRYAEYWRQETLQTTFSYKYNKSWQESAVVYVADTREVRIPSDLIGHSFNVAIKNLMTPTTIALANLSYSLRTDRPNAQGISLEMRQYITPTDSAIHGAYSYYRNVGELQPVTDYGEIVAHTMRTELHQKLPRFMKSLPKNILMVGYRYYTEDEDPLGDVAENVVRKSDWIYGSLRFLLSKGGWVKESSELQLFGGRYAYTDPINGLSDGLLYGIGAKLLF